MHYKPSCIIILYLSPSHCLCSLILKSLTCKFEINKIKNIQTSALNLDIGLKRYFEDSKDEEYYGSVRLQPLAYIDDIARSNHDVNAVRAGNEKFSSLALEKQFLVLGTENYKTKVKLESKEEAIKLGKDILHEKDEEKYLGDVLSSGGLAESVQATVQERTGKIKGAIYELGVLIEDIRMQAIGGMDTAIELYKSCIVPSLMANCATWMDIRKETEKKLDAIQDLFGKVLLQMPQSTPKMSIRAALGLLSMRHRVWQKKIFLVAAIWQQDDDCLARQVLEEQVRQGWPGLAREVKEICRQVGLPDATDQKTVLDKEAIKIAIKVHHLQTLKENMTGQKIQVMKQTDMRQRQPYTKLRVDKCRMAFRLEVYQFDCRANMPTRYKRDLCCRACGPGVGEQKKEQEKEKEQQEEVRQIEDQKHLEVCKGYSELWVGDIYK